MENIDIIKAYFAALDSSDFAQAEQYLDESYQMVGFAQQPMGKEEVLEMVRLLREAMPNLSHSLSNIRQENNLVKLTVQRSGTNSANLDLRKMGIGIVPSTQKFIIFPNADYEFEIKDGKITKERDVSPASPNRRMSGMLKALGINLAAR